MLNRVLINFLLAGLFLLKCGLSAQSEKAFHQPPVPNFDVNGLCYGSITHFKNLSAAATSYTWNIYEPTALGAYTIQIFSSTSTDITFQFPHKGTFKVELLASNGHLGYLARILNYDTITKAAFEYQNCQGRFVNLCSCADTFNWDMGDGTGSTLPSPTYYYSTIGTFTPTLKAQRGFVADSAKGPVNASPNLLSGAFTFTIKKDSVFFVANDSLFSGLPDFYWTYGDLNKDIYTGLYGQKIKHRYQQGEEDVDYTVFLLVRDICNSAYSAANIHIEGNKPVKGTSFYPNPPENGLVHVTSDKKNSLNSVKIFNIMGQEMNSYIYSTTPKGIDIDLSLLPTGIYSVQLDFNGDKVTGKIINNR